MKKLSTYARERLIRKQREVVRRWIKLNRAQAVIERRRKKNQRRRIGGSYVPAIRHFAPTVVTIEDPAQRSALIEFLKGLRRHYVEHPSRTLLIDFSRTSHFVAGGTLLLYAELNRLIAFSNNSVTLRCTEPANDRASQVLKQIGIYRICSNRSSVRPTRHDVVHWQVVQGTLVDNSLCAPAIEGFQNRIDLAMIDELLGGLGEAMTNAIQHAYEETRQDGLEYPSGTNWWMFSQAKDGRLSVVFCDLGAGIPATLPLKRPSLWERLIHRKPHPTDGDCISEAIVEGKTRTGLDGRGYGLGNIVDVVEKIPTGIVNVFSNRGRYDSRSGNPYDYEDSILGTLIYWNVPMKTIPTAGVQ